MMNRIKKFNGLLPLAFVAAWSIPPGAAVLGQKQDTADAEKAAGATDKVTGAASGLQGDRAAFESAKKELLASWANLRAFSLGIATEGEFQRADLLQRNEGGGTYDCLKKDGKIFVRAERRTQAVSVPGETHVQSPSNWALMVSDGDAVYTHQKRGSQEQVFKDPIQYNQLPHMGAEECLRDLELLHHYQMLPDDKIGDHDCYVFQGQLESGNPTLTYHLDKAAGLLVRFKVDDKLNHRWHTMNVLTIQRGKGFGKDYFRFKRPEGVPFTDRAAKLQMPDSPTPNSQTPGAQKPGAQKPNTDKPTGKTTAPTEPVKPKDEG